MSTFWELVHSWNISVLFVPFSPLLPPPCIPWLPSLCKRSVSQFPMTYLLFFSLLILWVSYIKETMQYLSVSVWFTSHCGLKVDSLSCNKVPQRDPCHSASWHLEPSYSVIENPDVWRSSAPPFCVSVMLTRTNWDWVFNFLIISLLFSIPVFWFCFLEESLHCL